MAIVRSKYKTKDTFLNNNLDLILSQIVYKLYRLTVEEFCIIEKSYANPSR